MLGKVVRSLPHLKQGDIISIDVGTIVDGFYGDAAITLPVLVPGRVLVEHAPEGLCAGEIAERLSLAAPTLSFHLKELSQAGLIASRQDGRFIWYRADLSAMNGLVGYLTENCCRASSVCRSNCFPRT